MSRAHARKCFKTQTLTTPRSLRIECRKRQKEVIDKDLFSRGEEQLAWQVVLELVRYWIYPGGVIGQRGGFGDVVTRMSLYEMLIQGYAG